MCAGSSGEYAGEPSLVPASVGVYAVLLGVYPVALGEYVGLVGELR